MTATVNKGVFGGALVLSVKRQHVAATQGLSPRARAAEPAPVEAVGNRDNTGARPEPAVDSNCDGPSRLGRREIEAAHERLLTRLVTAQR